MSRSSLLLVLAAVICFAGCGRPGDSRRFGAQAEAQVAPEQAEAQAGEPRLLEAPEFHDGCLHVVDTHGQPVAGATVWRIRGYGWYAEADGEFTTDDRGCIPDAVPVGTLFRYVAYKSGYALGREEPVLPGADRVILLPPPSGRRVRVLGPDDEPVAGARLYPGAYPGDAPQPLWGETDADGYATLTLSSDYRPPLGYRVIAPGLAMEYYGETADVVRLQRAGSLVVRAVGTDDRAGHAGCTVSAGLLQRFGGRDRITVENLAPGTLVLYLAPSSDDRLYPVEPRREVQIEAGQTTQIDVEFRRAWPVSGRIVGEDGVPIVNAEVIVHPVERGVAVPRGVITDAAGRYSLHLLPGAYRLFPSDVPPPHTFYRTSRNALEFAVDATEDNRVPDFVVPLGVTIRGRVVDEDGRPVPRAEVLYLGETSSAAYMNPPVGGGLSHPIAITDQNGEFASPGWFPWRLTFAARTEDAVSVEPVVAAVADGTFLELPVSHEAAAWLEGAVRTTDGRPVTTTSVLITAARLPGWGGPDRRGEPSIRPPGGWARVQLDAAGEFRLGPLIPGAYSARVQTFTPSEQRPEARQVVLKPGSTERVVLTVEPSDVAMPEVR